MTRPPLLPSMLCPSPPFPSFKPSQLRVPIRRAGGQSSEPPPEAQYQQGFYRCVLEATLGHVRVIPEFASAKNAKVAGRIDLLIPNPNWGIEINRDGSRLNAHDARSQDNGTYGAWTRSMDDYILLDFRRGVPRQSHPSTTFGLSLCSMTNIKSPRSTTSMSNS